MGHSQTQQCVGERLDRETKKASEKKQSNKRKYGALTNTAMCWGEADKVTKKAGEKKKREARTRLTAMVGKKLGQIVARKRHALTAMRWQEIGMEGGTKKSMGL